MLNNLIRRSVVLGYVRKRSLFDKTNYVPYYLPSPVKYHKFRKPRLSEWSDPNVVYPPVLPPPTKLRFKGLINELEREELERRKLLQPFVYPKFKTGDLISFHYLHSMSQGRGNEYTGIVIGKYRQNSLYGSFCVVGKVSGVPVKFKIKMNSPLVVNFKLVAKGSGNLRAKLNYIWEKVSINDKLNSPIFKKKSGPWKENTVANKIKKHNSSKTLNKFEDDTI